MKNNEIEHVNDYNLLPYNTLRIESVAQDVYIPANTDEFALLLANLDNPLIIGRGSNLLLSSSGIKRPVILTKNLNKVSVNSPYIEAQAGVQTPKLPQVNQFRIPFFAPKFTIQMRTKLKNLAQKI